MSADVTNIVIVVSIDEAEAHGQNYGQVSNAYITVVDSTNATELSRYDLAEDASTETAMVIGELYRREGEWKFRAIGTVMRQALRGSYEASASMSREAFPKVRGDRLRVQPLCDFRLVGRGPL